MRLIFHIILESRSAHNLERWSVQSKEPQGLNSREIYGNFQHSSMRKFLIEKKFTSNHRLPQIV